MSKFKVKSKHNKNNKTQLNEDLSVRQTALQKLFIFATPHVKRKEPKNINQNFQINNLKFKKQLKISTKTLNSSLKVKKATKTINQNF